jgi:hypothetical protein
LVPASGDGERALTVRISNRSTTLHPNLVIYDASKSEISSAHNATPGGGLSHAFKVGPGPAYVRASDYYAKNGGGYTLTVAPQ